MRTGIEKSRNLMTIRLSDKIGMKKILETAKDFKIHKYMDENLSMSLGSGSVTLINLTNAYSMIVNGGKSVDPTLIVSVHDKLGNQIIINEIKKCENCNQLNKNLDYDLPKILSNYLYARRSNIKRNGEKNIFIKYSFGRKNWNNK